VNEHTQKIAIVFLGAMGVTSITGAVFLSAQGATIPEPLVALAGVVAGALATFSVKNGK
jgi:hypothetical protein